jgi:hypothetical protein
MTEGVLDMLQIAQYLFIGEPPNFEEMKYGEA